jgi:hypothetical protein
MTRRDARLRPSAYGLGLRRASRRRKMTQFIELSPRKLSKGELHRDGISAAPMELYAVGLVLFPMLTHGVTDVSPPPGAF